MDTANTPSDGEGCGSSRIAERQTRLKSRKYPVTGERRKSSRERRALLMSGANVKLRRRVAATAKAERVLLLVKSRAPLARSRLPGIFPSSSSRVRDLDTVLGNHVRSVYCSSWLQSKLLVKGAV
jgi:hypothetical protein